ncbi:hypothetical protein OK006_11090 [Actinobacteria bacterium OK006]|nr:hypothetical protein OK006_11090 [Actinobacteria bacterium OK006]
MTPTAGACIGPAVLRKDGGRRLTSPRLTPRYGGEVGLVFSGLGGSAAGPVRAQPDVGEQLLLIGQERVVLGALGGQPRGERAARAGESGRGIQGVAVSDVGARLVSGALRFQGPGRVPPGVDRGQCLGSG